MGKSKSIKCKKSKCNKLKEKKIRKLKEKKIKNIKSKDIQNNNNSEEMVDITKDNILQCKTAGNYANLVFSGGSIKGISFCGVLDVLNKRNILYDNTGKLKITGIAGASAGSIFATLFAIGYTPDEIKDIIMTTDFGTLLDYPKIFDIPNIAKDAENLIKNYGLCPGRAELKFLGTLIKNKVGDEDYTIQQLFDNTGVKLVIVTTNMNTQLPVYFCPNASDPSYSNIPIRKAIGMSTSIPFVFEPVLFNGDLHADGGILDNYPIHALDSDIPNNLLNIKTVEPNPHTLGFRIASEVTTGRTEIKSLYDCTSCLLSALLDFPEEVVVGLPWNSLRTINVVTQSYSVTNFSLTDEQKIDLINSGITSTDNFFSSQ